MCVAPALRAASAVLSRGAVVDDQRLDGSDAVDFLGKIAQRLRDGRLFVEGGDLNDQFHACCAVKLLSH